MTMILWSVRGVEASKKSGAGLLCRLGIEQRSRGLWYDHVERHYHVVKGVKLVS